MPKPYDAIPFTTREGHVLNPGDPAIALTRSAGQPGLVIGKYLGTRLGRGRWNRNQTQVVMEVNRERMMFLHKENGTRFNWNDQNAKKSDYTWVKGICVGYTTLQNNKIYPGDIALRNVTI